MEVTGKPFGYGIVSEVTDIAEGKAMEVTGKPFVFRIVYRMETEYNGTKTLLQICPVGG